MGIFQLVPVGVLLLLAAAANIAGDFFAKQWSTAPSSLPYVLALASYFLGAVIYIPSLLREGLVVTSLIWNLLTTLGFIIIGLVIFKEHLTMLQGVAAVLGTLALILLSIGK